MRDTVRTPRSWFRAQLALLGTHVANVALNRTRDVLFWRGEPPEAPRNVVVHLIGNIGDIVVAIPALMALRDRYPAARLTLLTSAGKSTLPGARDILSGVRYIDDIVEYSVSEAGSVRDLASLLRTVRSLGPDLVVMLPPSMAHARTLARNLVFARLTGARFAVGLEAAALPIFLLEQAIYRPIAQHEVERYLGLLKPLGVPAGLARFELPLPEPVERAQVDAIVDRVGRFIAVCPGGKQAGHLWPAERFAAVAARAKEEGRYEVVTIGSEQDRESCERVLALAGGGTNVCGQLSVLGTAHLLRRAALMLTNDTGPMHIAAAIGTPVVAIFASRDFAGRWYPYGSGHEVFRARLVCEKCLFAPVRTDHCVREITVDDVWNGCQRVLGATSTRAKVS